MNVVGIIQCIYFGGCCCVFVGNQTVMENVLFNLSFSTINYSLGITILITIETELHTTSHNTSIYIHTCIAIVHRYIN